MQGSAEANAKSLLTFFVAVALKKEILIKHVFCFCSVLFREAEGVKVVDLQGNTDLVILMSVLI